MRRTLSLIDPKAGTMEPLRRPRLALWTTVGVSLMCLLWMSCYHAAYQESSITWSSNEDGWGGSTDDWQSLLWPAAAVVAVAFVWITWDAIRHSAHYLWIGVAATAAGLGWYHSIDAYQVPVEDVVVWIIAMAATMVISAALLVDSVMTLWRRYGFPHRAHPGLLIAVARPHNWTDDGGQAAMIAFQDHTGVRHDLRSPLDHELRHRPLLAIYDPNDPSDPDKLHIGVPYVPEDQRSGLWESLKRELPAPGDESLWEDAYSRDPGVSLMWALDRVVDRRRDNELTAEEFEAEKWRALERYVNTGSASEPDA
ncbi:hypothetical protein [Stackebrandtia soli]|uniref:hypothetical protein n=1 Tax=Stackebrandtia soli TaxID=1892856 RepID=UPI0039EC5B3C